MAIPTLEAALQINQLGKSWFLFGSLNFEWRAVQGIAGARTSIETWAFVTWSSVPRQLPAAPMMVFAIGIEHALDVAVQCPHDADARKHRRPARGRDQDQSFHGRLPVGSLVLGLRKLRDVVASVLERDKLATARQRDWFFEPS